MVLVEIRSVKKSKIDVGQCGGAILNKARLLFVNCKSAQFEIIRFSPEV
jgi:hypothetical protein